jgi:hypothetical protein
VPERKAVTGLEQPSPRSSEKRKRILDPRRVRETARRLRFCRARRLAMSTTIAFSQEELTRLVASSGPLEDYAEADPGAADRCLAQRPINKREHVAVQARHAASWVRSQDWSYVFSFNNVCTALDIDPDRMRRKLLEGPLELSPGPMRLRRVENRPRRKRRPRSEDEQSAA